jgi:hypothetical protein
VPGGSAVGVSLMNVAAVMLVTADVVAAKAPAVTVPATETSPLIVPSPNTRMFPGTVIPPFACEATA